MAAWSDLPTEIKLLILRHYVDLVLTEYSIEFPHSSITTPIDRIWSFTKALPDLRIDVLECCYLLVTGDLRAVIETEKGECIDLKQSWKLIRSWEAWQDIVERMLELDNGIQAGIFEWRTYEGPVRRWWEQDRELEHKMKREKVARLQGVPVPST